MEDNFLICEYEISEKELKNPIQILNCYEQIKNRDSSFKGIDNEKELKENCELYLNDEKIDFSFEIQFKKVGNNIIKIKCKKPLINMNYMFFLCTNLTIIDFSNFNSSLIETMSFMFYMCSSLKDINLSNFKSNNLKNLNNMFFNCSSLLSLDLLNFNTEKVTDMSYMFYGCKHLNFLNISHFKTDKVTDMSHMFYECSDVNNLDIGKFNTKNVKDMSYMFFFVQI